MSAMEREMRKAKMQTSNWVAAAEGGSREYIPVSSTPLDAAYQRSKSITRSEYLGRLSSHRGQSQNVGAAPAADYIAKRTAPLSSTSTATSLNIVFGSDDNDNSTSNVAYGETQALPRAKIDLLQTVAKMRDTTLDGAHRASMTEGHFLPIWDPYVSAHRDRSRSFQSSIMLREGMHRHVRSQYHPEEKYVLPPTVQNDMGWGLDLAAYKGACAKFQEGAEWHGRAGAFFFRLPPTAPKHIYLTEHARARRKADRARPHARTRAGSHITKFSERLLLGARHHLSGPMTNPKLHY